MSTQDLLNLAYLLAAGLFIFGIKGLTSPKTAVRGNLLAALGMLVAVVAALVGEHIVDWRIIVIGVIVGSVIGGLLAQKVAMTAMPQLVALFNGFGGGASIAVAMGSYHATLPGDKAAGVLARLAGKSAAVQLDNDFIIAAGATALIGGVTLTGSLVAFAKLQELITGSAISFPGQKLFNAVVAAASVGCIVWLVIEPGNLLPLWILAILSAVLGVTLTIPIGGADMPVVIALLNSYSGLAAAATGFVLGNSVLIISGSLVGASGIILTQIMCKAMNRSLTNVLFGIMGEGATMGPAGSDAEVYQGKIKSTSAEEVAMLFEGAQRVIIVPGFGLAMAQAQHAVRDLADTLEQRGIEVEYAIHPVAGRMPGHMNVLLAEAEVPYEKLKEMEIINPSFEQTDVAIVIGANDVVNPVARDEPGSPIYGMPILNVDKARTVVVIKRSLSPGFAGIPNPLFAKDNTLMLFGDGKQAVLDLVAATKEL